MLSVTDPSNLTIVNTHHPPSHPLTKGHCSIGHQNEECNTDEEVLCRFVEAYHVVAYAGEEEGQEKSQGELCEVLADKVDIASVHAVEMFSEEDGEFRAECLCRMKSDGVG